MGSLGDANNMFIGQFNFPAEYTDEDKFIQADSDRILSWDYDGFRKTLMKFVGSGEMDIGSWVGGTRNGEIEATNENIMAFIKEALKADSACPGVKWTGWQVTGTVHRGNGFPIYTLSLFANRSGVKVYSDQSAPNVDRGDENGLLIWDSI
jgi:hypothetical protein